MEMAAKSKLTEASFEAEIIRGDGTVIPLGVVSYWHRNPLKRLKWKMTQGRRVKRLIEQTNKEAGF